MQKNIKKGIITTIIGSLFLGASLFYFVYPMVSPDYVVDTTVLLIGIAAGAGLIFSPDTVFKTLSEKI